MRLAKKNDHWRDIYEKEKSSRLVNFTINSKDSLNVKKINLKIGISAIVGRNGAGKSTLLKLMHNSFKHSPEDGFDFGVNFNLKNFTLESEILIHGSTHQNVISDCPVNENRIDLSKTHNYYIDTVNTVLKIQNFFIKFENEDLKEILSTTEENILKPNSLEEISQIVGKKYSNISLYELEDFEEDIEDLGTIPYFIVTSSSGEKYSSENMGQGEYFVFYLWWFFTYKIEKNAFVFIEEPENLLFPGAQIELFYFLLKQASLKKLAIILTSHSEHILKTIPNDHIFIIQLDKNTISNFEVEHDSYYMQQLGIISTPKNYIFVEDQSAKYFCEEIFTKHDPKLSKEFNIVPVPCGGDAILDIIKKIEGTSIDFKYVGAIDKDKYIEKIKDIKSSKLVAIPGSKAPDYDLKTIAYSNREDFLNSLGINNVSNLSVLNSLETVDYHDWLEHLSKGVNIKKDIIFDALFG